MEKPREILQIEDIYKLELTSLDSNLFYLGNVRMLNTYSINEENEITHLCLTGNNIYDIGILQGFQDLEYLCLLNTNIEYLDGLQYLINLETLIIQESNIFEIGNLEYLPNLKELNLSKNQILSIDNLGGLKKLVKLDLSNNELNDIEGFDNLEILKDLNLSHNFISEIYELDHLNLEYLNLSYNQISEIQNLKIPNLKSLDLSYNNLTKITGLSEVILLEKLELRHNKISKIENIQNLVQLKSLDLGFNNISMIEGLENLLELKQLHLPSNKINKIEGLDNLKDLDSLFLSYNEIAHLINLEKCENLKSLSLQRNKISNINGIENNSKIIYLNLSSNKISNIKYLQNFNDLFHLDISQNKLQTIKNIELLDKLKSLRILKINDNPFINDSDLILDNNENHYDLILNEIRKYQAKKIEIALPLKICLLGNHASGKSTFLNYFFTNKAKNDNSTHILDIRPFKSKRTEKLPEAIFYDFGGQDYYHGIYKAFLTQTSTNLLFWNKETDTNELKPDSKGQKNINFNKKYWLGQINYIEELEGESSDNKNIYQIQTHSDIHSQEILQNKNTKRFIYLSFEEKSLQKDSYKLILQSFKAEILEAIKSRLQKEISNEEYELYKFIVNNKRINEVNIKDILTYYNKTEDEINLLQAELDQLSKRGLILYYKNCKSLKNIAWLQPAKTVAEIYKIFNENILRQYNGEIPKDIFEKKINNQNLLELLKYNKVIFLDDKSKSTKYIVPGYLKSTTDEGDDYFIFGDFNKFNFILKFENFIPFGFMNQLICKYGGKYEAKSFRKDQLIFTTQEKDVKVLIRLDFRKLLIKVGVISKVEKKISEIEKKIFYEILLTYWAIEMDLTNNDLNYDISDYQKNFLSSNTDVSNMDFNEKREYIKNLDIYTLVRSQFLKNNMAPEDMYLSVDSKNFVHYHTLENEDLITSNISSYGLKENGDLIKSENSISTIQFQNFSNNKNIKNMKKVFISYSHEDVVEKQRLMTFLKPLERSGKINIWQDLKLEAGVKVKQEILDKLDEADIIIMLVSQDFIGSDFIYDHELQIAMKKRIHNKVKILPVMISECTIFDLDLFIDQDENQRVKMGDYYFVPQDEKNNIKPIRLWESHLQDSAWKKVYEQLKRLLD